MHRRDTDEPTGIADGQDPHLVSSGHERSHPVDRPLRPDERVDGLAAVLKLGPLLADLLHGLARGQPTYLKHYDPDTTVQTCHIPRREPRRGHPWRTAPPVAFM